MKSSTYYFHRKTKILADFQICISVPVIGSGTENVKIKLDDFTFTNSKKERLHGIIFHNNLKFQYHIKNLCKQSSLKLSLLPSVNPFVDLPQNNILFDAFFSHSLATALWHGFVIAEYSITK